MLHRILRDDHIERLAVYAIDESHIVPVALTGGGDQSTVRIKPRNARCILPRYRSRLIAESAPEIQ